jgi:hypothetical protein
MDDGLKEGIVSAAVIGTLTAELLAGHAHDRAGPPVHLPEDRVTPPATQVITVQNSGTTGVIDDSGAAWQQTLRTVALAGSLPWTRPTMALLHVPEELPAQSPVQVTTVDSGGARRVVLDAAPGL